MQVFCGKCRHSTIEQHLGRYTSIKFVNSTKKIDYNSDLCTKNMKIEKEIETTPIEQHTFKRIFVEDPLIKNAENNCSDFKQKFLGIF